MRLILYYLTRSVKNQIRKLFRTWVAVLLLVCLVFGLVIGIGAGALAGLLEDETQPDTTEEIVEDSDEELTRFFSENATQLLELAAGGIGLLVIVFAVLTADKSGGAIFLMADVNLLFPAPLLPQSVLLFRLIMQMGASIVATVFLLFQIPNLVLNMGLPPIAVPGLIGAWLLLFVFSKLISVLLYTLCSTHATLKRHLRSGLFACLFLIIGGFFVFAMGKEDHLSAAFTYFNAPITRWIPIWGWLKAILVFGVEGKILPCLAATGASILLAVVMTVVVRRIKADFYEDAMARSEATAQLQQAAQNNGKAAMLKRKKDRKDTLMRDGLNRGQGASVYFWKSMYNRFRFAHLHVLTKTAETDLVVALGISALFILVLHNTVFPVIPIVLSLITFMRALGNPIAEDIQQESFFLVPDSAHKKIFFSFLGGVANSALDLLPAFAVSAVLLWVNPLEVLLWYLLTVAIGAYADSTGLFINLSLSTGLAQQIRAMVQILFIYFGLAPAAVLLIVGFALNLIVPFAIGTLVLLIAVTGLFLFLSPLFLLRGRK